MDTVTRVAIALSLSQVKGKLERPRRPPSAGLFGSARVASATLVIEII